MLLVISRPASEKLKISCEKQNMKINLKQTNKKISRFSAFLLYVQFWLMFIKISKVYKKTVKFRCDLYIYYK